LNTILALNNVHLAGMANTFISLVSAFALGGLIGLERQYRQRTAGLRTNVIVAVGAAINCLIIVKHKQNSWVMPNCFA